VDLIKIGKPIGRLLTLDPWTLDFGPWTLAVRFWNTQIPETDSEPLIASNPLF